MQPRCFGVGQAELLCEAASHAARTSSGVDQSFQMALRREQLAMARDLGGLRVSGDGLMTPPVMYNSSKLYGGVEE